MVQKNSPRGQWSSPYFTLCGHQPVPHSTSTLEQKQVLNQTCQYWQLMLSDDHTTGKSLYDHFIGG